MIKQRPAKSTTPHVEDEAAARMPMHAVEIQFHPLADIFPLIEGVAFREMVEDIREHGLRDAIVLHDGMILDGRNRYRACHAAQTDARFETFRGKDPLGFVISKNLRRRHLDESQRAMVAARLADLGQGRPGKPANLPDSKRPPTTQPQAAKLLNVSERSVRAARTVQTDGAPELVRAVEQGKLAVSAGAQATKLNPEQQREIAREAEAGRANVVRNVIKKGTRAVREQDLAQKIEALPDKKFGVILADPEWQFEVYSRETGMDRAADNHYPTSGLDAIKARDVGSIAADDAVLFLWATAPMLPQALEVMAAWGFTYKSHVIWDKQVTGTGYWFRNCHEILLVGTRGKIPAPAMGEQFPSIVASTAGDHSAKPAWQYDLIEKYFPTVPKIELNARGPARPGWETWGNEAETVDRNYPKAEGEAAATSLRDDLEPVRVFEAEGQFHSTDDIPDFLRRSREITPGVIA